ncbi:hypothetical protein NP233_g11955 [Leucocoprinus birnbaumii]|uniref:J domain-containing protein n=1 Tax=Leucocoprinus birnbaumii TaxID=56174 RepID=A0AAD5VL83_9AGAR|nr:hypothetical protein NP233_g11955 [Leucocoprinus birnbaumii]
MAAVQTLNLLAPPLHAEYTAPKASGSRLSPPHAAGHRTLLPVGPAYLNHLKLTLKHGHDYEKLDRDLEEERVRKEQEEKDGAGQEDDLGVGEEPETDELLSLDPKEWKKHDYYAVLGLSHLRWKATPEQIKIAHRKKVLKHHPDKKVSSAPSSTNNLLQFTGTNTNDDAFFKCISKAHEVLSHPEKRRQFDSVDPQFIEWEEDLPSTSIKNKKEVNFFKTFAPIFEEYSRFSRVQPVPRLGAVDATKAEVEGFYDFWYNFDSWRSFEWWDKEVNEGSDNRDDKRYTEKKNKSERARRKKEDTAKLRGLVDLTLSLDPRIKRIKQEEKEAREAKKRGNTPGAPAKKTKQQEEEEKKKAEEEARKKEEEEKVARAEAKKAKAAAANAAKKARRAARAAEGAESIISASRRLAMPSGRANSILAALDSLDLDDPTEVVKPQPRRRRVAGEKVEVVEQKKSTVERLQEFDAPFHPVYQPPTHKQATSSKTLVAEPTTKATKTRSRNTKPKTSAPTGWADELVASDKLPVYSYKDYDRPKAFVVYTRHEEETNDLIDGLYSGPVAMDLEWRVMYYRNPEGKNVQMERRTAIVQIADRNGLVLVVQVNGMRRFPERLQALIENPKIPKVGVNILNDGKKLFRDYGIMAKNLVELGSVALVVDPSPISNRKIVSLAKLVERYCGKMLDKGPERTSNWEEPLTIPQTEYAANDAHSSLEVYKELLNLAKTNSCSLENGSAQFTSEVTWSNAAGVLSQSDRVALEGMRPQYLRAYEYWHKRRLSLEDMCVKLSLKHKGSYGPIGEGESVALKPATVISYVISALQNNSKLEYERERLVELVQMDLGAPCLPAILFWHTCRLWDHRGVNALHPIG